MWNRMMASEMMNRKSARRAIEILIESHDDCCKLLCAGVDAWTSGAPHYTGEPTNLRRESANFLRARTRSMSSDMLSASISRSLSELDKPLLLSGSRGIHLSPL